MLQSEARPRINTAQPVPASPMAVFGVPGVPYPEINPVAPTFSQGEDIVYDLILRVDEKNISPDKWTIVCTMKKSEFAMDVPWQGTLNDGLYYDTSTKLYQMWIPRCSTADLFAGSYFVDIVATEQVGSGEGVKDRRILLITIPMLIQYTVSSPHPDSVNKAIPGSIKHRDNKPSYPLLIDPQTPSL